MNWNRLSGRPVVGRIAAAVLSVALTGSGANPAEGPGASDGGAVLRGPLFAPGKPIPVASTYRSAQIGGTEEFQSIPIGTADVFGNGPYDLFVADRLFPFREFDEAGVPQYGPPRIVDGERAYDVVTGPDGVIYGLSAEGRRVSVLSLQRHRLRFVKQADSAPLDLPGGMGGAMAGWFTGDGRLCVYSTFSGPNNYRPPGDHHSATYIPYDGAGFWRGEIPRRVLSFARFDGPRLKSVEAAERCGEGPGDFLFSVRGFTVVNLGRGRPPALVTSEKLGSLRCYPLDPATGRPGPPQFVNNEDRVALRHHVINPAVKSIPDPENGLSNLIVGDTGRVWFYPFTGEFAENGSPVYGKAKPLTAEGMHLVLGELPVISAGDVDRDGLVDLMAGNDAGELLFVRNIGEAERPEFDHPRAVPVGGRPLDIKAGYRGSIQGPGEAAWGYTCPTLVDWNGDGLLDVILNSITADYLYLKQIPSDDGPAFAEPQWMYCDGLQLHLAWRSQPGVTDWGAGPGARLCLIALDEQNLLRCFWRIDDQNVERGKLLRLHDGSPITANVDEAAGQTGRAKLAPHDWDGDGDVDLVIGTSRGLSLAASPTAYLPSHYYPDHKASVLLLRNVGTNSEPVFEYVQQFCFERERIKLGIHSCSPAPVDLGRGVIDLLVGEETGSIRYYPREWLSVSGVDD